MKIAFYALVLILTFNAWGATYTGKLKTGVMAIGGETTGKIVITPQGTYEVSGPADILDPWNGRIVTINGTLRTKLGVEIPHRYIIDVKSVTVYAVYDTFEGVLEITPAEDNQDKFYLQTAAGKKYLLSEISAYENVIKWGGQKIIVKGLSTYLGPRKGYALVVEKLDLKRETKN
jgi:hypothetical protein